ncbi:MAG: MBOAT family protein [Chrysiogenales bacterium]|nr:MAG: MBOAT family protein [Chrysiogenales bacterium]
MFYISWNPSFGLTLLTTTITIYVAAVAMDGQEPSRKRLILVGAVIVNLGILIFFKYSNFFFNSLKDSLQFFNIDWQQPTLKILLPVGISFYTFQALGYCIDVYRGDRKPERHFGKFALFVSFFPLILAGPIERSGRLLPQFEEKKQFSYDRAVSGLLLFCFGLIKKIVIADRLAVYVNTVFGDIRAFNGSAILLAAYFFTIQIYCDFSGYSDMAIGTARIMGYDIMENFRQPYRSLSIAEFWRRWHISLSSWFRDYLYVPLGGNRVARLRWYFNIMIVFLLSGLWHGAQWTFVVWGGLHGLFLCAGAGFRKIRGTIAGIMFGAAGKPLAIAIILVGLAVSVSGYLLPPRWYGPDPRRLLYLEQIAIPLAGLCIAAAGFIKGFKQSAVGSLRKIMSIALTFHLVMLGWIFFRAEKMADAWYAVTHLFMGKQTLKLSAWYQPNFKRYEFIIAGLAIILLIVIDSVQARGELRERFAKLPAYIRWPVYQLLVIIVLLFGIFTQSKFIYSNF